MVFHVRQYWALRIGMGVRSVIPSNTVVLIMDTACAKALKIASEGRTSECVLARQYVGNSMNLRNPRSRALS